MEVIAADRQDLKRSLLAAAALLFAITGFVVLGLHRHDLSVGIAIFAIAEVLAAVFYGRYHAVSLQAYRGPDPVSKVLITPGKKPLRTSSKIAECIAGHDDFAHSASIFLQMLLEPAAQIVRISETVEQHNRSLSIASSFVIRLPVPTGPYRLAVPLWLSRRGYLESGLRIQNSDGQRMSTLGREETSIFIAASFRYYIQKCSDKVIDAYVDRDLERKVVSVLAGPQRTPRDGMELLIRELCSLARNEDEYFILSLISRAIRRLNKKYPICIEVSGPGSAQAKAEDEREQRTTTLRVSMERRILSLKNGARGDSGHAAENRWRRLVSRVREWFNQPIEQKVMAARQWLGIRSSTIMVPLINADRAKSYHLQLKGPEGTYVARQNIVSRPRSSQLGSGLAPQATAIQYAERQGQRHAHLYLQDASGFSRSYFECRFYERMPGSVGPSTLAALAAFVIILICASSFYVKPSGPDSNLVSVLLAAPAVMGAWAGFDAARTLSGGTLVARVSAISTIILALAAALVYAGYPFILSKTGPQFNDFIKFVWIMLVGLAALNVISIGLSWFIRFRVQSHFLNQGEDIYGHG